MIYFFFHFCVYLTNVVNIFNLCKLFFYYFTFKINFFKVLFYYSLNIVCIFFFNNQNMPDALYFLTLLKIGSAGLRFWFLAKQTFKIPKWSHVTLSVSYALMSFIVAHSELIMWLDAFIYLPLVILGIHRLMDQRKPTLLFVSYFLLFITNYYFGFMIGLFSFLYYFARTFTDWQRY